MRYWKPSEEWKNQDAFIIGGGPSLRAFDFARLRGKRTIGCNSAFLLGADICSICFFSDRNIPANYFAQLEAFAGRVATHCDDLEGLESPYFLRLKREESGLHRDSIGFGGNSGCSAINLALILGAKRVFLLGFDCLPENVRDPNWHDRVLEKSDASIYLRFKEGFAAIARDLPRVFPGRKIINLNPLSGIDSFPKQSPDRYL